MIKVDFDCGNTFYLEAPSEVGHINRERKNLSKCCEKSKSVPTNGQHKCSIDEQNTTYIFPNPYNSWETEPAALMSFKPITDGDSMSNKISSNCNPPKWNSLIFAVFFFANNGQLKKWYACQFGIFSKKLRTG